jgi:hypothetical protein
MKNTKTKNTIQRALIALTSGIALVLSMSICASPALARDVQYNGGEETVYVKPGEPTQITFPGKISGGFKKKSSSVSLERQDNYLIVFAQQNLSLDGESIIVHLADKRTYSLRVLPATGGMPKDGQVTISDNRAPEVDEEPTVDSKTDGPKVFAPPTAISGLMREMMLVSEFGKKKGIPGYRRSNRFSGETVLDDGALSAKIDEIFMGTDLWGYVLSVENKLQTNQKVNPATFRLDGTRAVSCDKWELSARPLTSEQQVAQAHKGHVYIVTRAKRR